MGEGTTNVPVTSCVVFGAGGHAVSVHDVVTGVGWSVVFFVGEASSGQLPAPLLATDGEALMTASSSGHRVLVAIGANDTRLRLWRSIPHPLQAAPVVAPSATVAASARLGDGTVVHHHAHVGPRSRVGEAVIVNTAAVVEHDCMVGDGVHLAPGSRLLGGCEVGETAFVGAGACVLPGVRVGRKAVIGAGAIVTRDVPAGATAVGAPARERTSPRA